MKWKKLGKIFDPSKYMAADSFFDFTQSPQALVFDDFVRIYFATRTLDRKGKYVSRIQYVDFDKELNSIISISQHEVFGPGKLGCFDEHGIFPMNVVRYNDKILAYTNGWSRRVSVSVETGIGFAFSEDNGKTFKRIGDGPIMTATTCEPVLVGDPFVKIINGRFHMWYLFGLGWKKFDETNSLERIYKISYANSIDGISWVKGEGKQIIPDKLNEDECQALPTVIQIGERYHMYFCYRSSFDFRKNRNNSYRIGYAFSDDLINWQRNDEDAGIDVSAEGWDSDMQCYPHIFEMNNKIYLLYNGNEFGKHGFGAAILEN
jgi:predicted GH43/DUF377 family glycosyl hydrolase